MAKQWLTWINLGIGGLAALLVIVALFVTMTRPSEITVSDPALTNRNLPPCAFAMSKQACDAIGKAALDLKFSPITLQIPDLKNHLLYFGKNGRPDAPTENPVLHFGFAANQSIVTPVPSGQRHYMLFDRTRNPHQYVFSPNNEETPLWIEATAQGNEAAVKVFMRNENGDIIKEPEANALLRIQERENRAAAGKAWDIGKNRVDGSLLAKQKARWMGPDLFLERHGGEEFKTLAGKQRIDFTEEEAPYSVYVGLNDSLIWDKDKWKVVQPGQESLTCPLMIVKKVEDRLVNFELWDVGGKNKVMLNLVKSSEAWAPKNILAKFKFLGARTRSQYIFEIDDQRMLLTPKDWLLQTTGGWIKLNTAKEIDDYVDRKITGILFVCDGLDRKEGKQVLKGVFFNPARTEIHEVELPVQQGFGQAAITDKKGKKDPIKDKDLEGSNEEEDEEEVDEEDIDD